MAVIPQKQLSRWQEERNACGQVPCGSGLPPGLALEADRQLHCLRRTKGRKSFADVLINRMERNRAVSPPISY
ncbi:MAG: hypothetical protein H8E73_05325 [Planctomycetes bacterium]|nr:hypothetical protein [Planctomycetota bacterium]